MSEIILVIIINQSCQSFPKDVKNQIKYCKMFGLKKLTESPTRITCSTSSIIGHILLNFPSRVTRQWMLNFELVDHKLL